MAQVERLRSSGLIRDREESLLAALGSTPPVLAHHAARIGLRALQGAHRRIVIMRAEEIIRLRGDHELDGRVLGLIDDADRRVAEDHPGDAGIVEPAVLITPWSSALSPAASSSFARSPRSRRGCQGALNSRNQSR